MNLMAAITSLINEIRNDTHLWKEKNSTNLQFVLNECQQLIINNRVAAILAHTMIDEHKQTSCSKETNNSQKNGHEVYSTVTIAVLQVIR